MAACNSGEVESQWKEHAEWDGFSIALARRLTQKLGMEDSYRIRCLDWDDMFIAAEAGECAAISGITMKIGDPADGITAENDRMAKFLFTVPTVVTGQKVATLRNPSNIFATKVLTRIFDPFDLWLWMWCLGMSAFVAASQLFFQAKVTDDWGRVSFASFLQEWYYALTTIANNPTRDETRDLDETRMDRNMYCPAIIVALVWQLTQVILIAMYTAILASALVGERDAAVKDRFDLVGKGVITFEGNEQTIRNLGGTPVTYPWDGESFDDGWKALLDPDNPIAQSVVMDAVAVDYYTNSDVNIGCDVIGVGEVFFPEFFGIALPRNHTSEPVRHALNVGLTWLKVSTLSPSDLASCCGLSWARVCRSVVARTNLRSSMPFIATTTIQTGCRCAVSTRSISRPQVPPATDVAR